MSWAYDYPFGVYKFCEYTLPIPGVIWVGRVVWRGNPDWSLIGSLGHGIWELSGKHHCATHDQRGFVQKYYIKRLPHKHAVFKFIPKSMSHGTSCLKNGTFTFYYSRLWKNVSSSEFDFDSRLFPQVSRDHVLVPAVLVQTWEKVGNLQYLSRVFSHLSTKVGTMKGSTKTSQATPCM